MTDEVPGPIRDAEQTMVALSGKDVRRLRAAATFLISADVAFFGEGRAVMSELGEIVGGAIEEIALVLGVKPRPLTDKWVTEWGNRGAESGQMFAWQHEVEDARRRG